METRKSLLNRTGRKRRLPTHTTLRCPMVGHQVSWCRMLCKPIEERGVCGRLAPHRMQDRTQQAIALHKSRRRMSMPQDIVQDSAESLTQSG